MIDDDRWAITVPITLQHICWSKRTGHANDPLIIALRHFFGIPKTQLLISLYGEHMKHRRLAITVHSPIDWHTSIESYELPDIAQNLIWRWIKGERINPFKCRIEFTEIQKEWIIQYQQIKKLPPLGVDQFKLT